MVKLTPAKRLKQLEKSGWLELISFLDQKCIHPRALVTGRATAALEEFHRSKAHIYLAQDMEYDMFCSDMSNVSRKEVKPAIIGLLEQIANPPKKTNKNKMVRRGISR